VRHLDDKGGVYNEMWQNMNIPQMAISTFKLYGLTRQQEGFL